MGSILETKRLGFALNEARKAAKWRSGKAFTQDDAIRFHVGLILVITALEGKLDEFIEGTDEDA